MLCRSAARTAATDTSCRRLWLITTNDNLRAIAFYQRWGMDLAALHRNFADTVRQATRPGPEQPYRNQVPPHPEFELLLEKPILEDTAYRIGTPYPQKSRKGVARYQVGPDRCRVGDHGENADHGLDHRWHSWPEECVAPADTGSIVPTSGSVDVTTTVASTSTSSTEAPTTTTSTVASTNPARPPLPATTT